ncbi:MAG: hypothetical protein M3N41_05730 [Acidobacteriota bacterium]|nr:hypothetical protein [Acidobacteriota bacterium]
MKRITTGVIGFAALSSSLADVPTESLEIISHYAEVRKRREILATAEHDHRDIELEDQARETVAAQGPGSAPFVYSAAGVSDTVAIQAHYARIAAAHRIAAISNQPSFVHVG